MALLVVGALVIAAILSRVVIWVAAPRVLDSLARNLGLELRSRKVSLSLLSGVIELSGVTAVARDGRETLLVADHLRADLALLRLLRGDVVFERVEVDGVDLVLEVAGQSVRTGRARAIDHTSEANAIVVMSAFAA